MYYITPNMFNKKNLFLVLGFMFIQSLLGFNSKADDFKAILNCNFEGNKINLMLKDESIQVVNTIPGCEDLDSQSKWKNPDFGSILNINQNCSINLKENFSNLTSQKILSSKILATLKIDHVESYGICTIRYLDKPKTSPGEGDSGGGGVASGGNKSEE